ncbi:NAD(P)/FAD-dependent oxidoreductase [Picosynechococcus sp. PCC 8807]|uniref:NAD(P)/FAD-dependent oxidoreductase n=1 Tax=Picosynechococcus sp. PCC 8807 TaxID=195248 RepID=UPI0008105241|nr:flavin-dependent dehydrogenase [Picosynechococcus sp. PCC 8807]ANV91112.1 flavin-dependent dehydrogenase [Picosynechococcus sp. PCC 8807]
MEELLYLEVPTPDTDKVCHWLQTSWQPRHGEKQQTPTGIRLVANGAKLSIFTWNVQRTTYLKVFAWASGFPQPQSLCRQLKSDLEQAFPNQYPAPPEIQPGQSIFDALAADYPKTVEYFQKFPQGEFDLQRAYWWEKRWRETVKNPQAPQPVIFEKNQPADPQFAQYDLVYIGGALGVIHAAVMARLGYKVLLIERLPFGRMNREWNISRSELQSLINLGLFDETEIETLVAREYKNGFNKFFDGNNPSHLKANILYTPTVLNIAVASELLLEKCGEKLRAAGGEIWDQTEFIRADIGRERAQIFTKSLATGEEKIVQARLLIDAMGTASPIAAQLNQGRPFDSVCPTVGAVVKGFDPAVWDSEYGDVLNSHGDISRGRQLIWELFPGQGDEMTIYLFHYHEVNPENPGSLLEMYEDFFSILPEYRRCDMAQLTFEKATFGYIPGYFNVGAGDRQVAFDRLLAIGDAASLQSPLVFTGFGSLVRNLDRLTKLLDIALQKDLLDQQNLSKIRAYQSNIAVTWLFSKGMMVPTGMKLPPQRINAMLNTFFGLLADSPPEVAETFIKDRTSWLMFNKLALVAARQNPALLVWIWQMAGAKDFIRWVGAYFAFSFDAVLSLLLMGWLPQWLENSEAWLSEKYPSLWLSLLSLKYRLTVGT